MSTTPTGPRRAGLRDLLAFVASTATLLSLCALAYAARESFSHGYLSLGFRRSAIFALSGAISHLALPVAGAALAVAAIAARSRSRARAVSIGVPLIAALAYLLRAGYVTNRYGLSTAWIQSREILGVKLPVALSSWEVWRENLLVVAGAIGVALGVAVVLRLLFGPALARGERLWRTASHPAWAALAAAALGGAPLAAARLNASGERDSVILISIDTLRADHLSCYGYARDTSPALDRLAAEGVRFETCMSPAPNTPPAHMSIFTSLYPTVHGFTGEGDRLADRRVTLTEHLREAGYRTAATTDGGYMRGWFGFGQGFERYVDRYKGIAASRDLVLEWLDRDLSRTPFFLFVHNYDVHSPYNPPPPYRTMYTDPGYDGGFFPGSRELERIRARVNRDPSAGHGLSDADIRHMIDRYDGGIRYTDDVVGELVAALGERGLLERTWIIVTSDHGEEFTEHGSVLHEKLYRSVTHVPLIVRPPDRRREMARGVRVAEVVELTDLMPTILELAAIEPGDEQLVQGASLVGFLERGTAPSGWKNTAFAEHPWRGRRRAITRPDVRVLTSLDHGELEAYAVRTDPLEQVNLALAQGDTGAGSTLPDTLRAALRVLLGWNEEQIANAARAGASTEHLALDEAAVEELRALGYLQ